MERDSVLSWVQALRAQHPNMGTRKLHYLMQPLLREHGMRCGRDRLFALLRSCNLLIRRKRHLARTTNSQHKLRVFPNLLADAQLDGPNQAWVADITYLRIGSTFRYLSLLTDGWSRMIVGWHLHGNLEASGPLRALQMAIRQRGGEGSTIHHSDRGIQYCCHEYLNQSFAAGLRTSMTADLHCYENALAERVNGILKNEYLLKTRFTNETTMRQATAQAIFLYNMKRPHWALNLATPAQRHTEEKDSRRPVHSGVLSTAPYRPFAPLPLPLREGKGSGESSGAVESTHHPLFVT